MSGGGSAGAATSPPPPPGYSGNPLQDVNDAWSYATGFFNQRAGWYALQLAGARIALGAALRG